MDVRGLCIGSRAPIYLSPADGRTDGRTAGWLAGSSAAGNSDAGQPAIRRHGRGDEGWLRRTQATRTHGACFFCRAEGVSGG